MSKTKNNVNALLAAIKRQTPEPAAPQTETEEQATHVTLAAEKPKRKENRPETTTEEKKTKTKSRVGKAVQFWMHEEDTQLVRELSAWLAGQGVRPSDSMVIRTALRYAKTGNALLEAYRQASRLDGRLKQD